MDPIKHTLLCAACLLGLYTTTRAQTTADLENISVPAAGYLNDAVPLDAFQSGNVSLHNTYDAQFLFWDGWAISKITDNTTPGFNNQYSAITGKGYNNSANYAVGYAYDGNYIRLDGAAQGGVVNGVYVTNSTYAYYSMLDGDAFAKKFGGTTGNDPDFFKLTIKKHLNGQLGTDSIDFFLADYRFSNNASDYIVKDWTYLDLRPLGNVDSLVFVLSSSDNGIFGMNTPAYFCIDHLVTADMTSSTSPVVAEEGLFSVFPNPASDYFTVQSAQGGLVTITDALGRAVWSNVVPAGTTGIACENWPSGFYFVQTGTSAKQFYKR